jgi:hypothetical protein
VETAVALFFCLFAGQAIGVTAAGYAFDHWGEVPSCWRLRWRSRWPDGGLPGRCSGGRRTMPFPRAAMN